MAKRGFYKESPAVSLKSFRAGPYRREAARPGHPCSRPPSNTHAQMPSHLTRVIIYIIKASNGKSNLKEVSHRKLGS